MGKPLAMPSDYDGAWKDVLQRRFLRMLEGYFPEIATAIKRRTALAAAIHGIHDLDRLQNLLRLAVTTPSFEDFALRVQGGGGK